MFSFGNTTPETPKGCKFEYKDGQTYQYSCEVSKTANWGDFRKVEIHYPIGTRKSNEYNRFLGYFPITGFYSGVVEIWEATNSIFHRVVKGQDQYETTEKQKDGENTLVTRTVTKLEFSLAQRGTILLISIANYIRGIITFFQLGILFAPLDYVANSLGRCCCKKA